ncbi:MAG: SRPBCC family protein [Pirellulales bacterium]
MSVTYEHTTHASCSAHQAFAVLDDLPRTSEWLKPCHSLKKIIAGPNAIGDRLKYEYSEGGRVKMMDGEIIARRQDEQIVCRYADDMFEVIVDLSVEPATEGCKLTHVITMTPKKFFAKILTPLIRIGIKKQTRDAMTALKQILEVAS